MTDQIVSFVRRKDLVFVRELGQGACGRTVLLHDDVIDENFVCKKYSPQHEPWREKLFGNFVREIKLLHRIYHPNIVRVFNYYLYPDQYSGYIIMEMVAGSDIEEYLTTAPQKINDVFLQTIAGFRYLENHEILHRDIRPQNIMVSDDGIVKIIDFGFGKKVDASVDFDKSITLNWWCQPPDEFKLKLYNYSTEVYFVGKLFEKLIIENGIDHFAYRHLLRQMCAPNSTERIASFAKIEQRLLSEQMTDVTFTDSELEIYRAFASQLSESVSKIENSTKYYEDPAMVEKRLEEAYAKTMLEEFVPSNNLILRCLRRFSR